jgi:hypothetical protein
MDAYAAHCIAVRLWVRYGQGHDGDPAKIMVVGDRFDTDVRAGLSAGFLTCLVTSGCHSIECQQHYLMDPMHHYAPGVGALVPSAFRPSPAMGTPVPTASRPSVLEGAQALQAWMLQQSSLLKLVDSADTLRATLRPVLQTYFRAIDLNDDGAIHGADVESALQSLRRVGMGGVLDLMQRRSCGATLEGPSADLASLAHHPPPDPALDFETFMGAMEGALAHCGFDVRQDGASSGEAGLDLAIAMSERFAARARSRVVRLSDEGGKHEAAAPAPVARSSSVPSLGMTERRSSKS